MRKKSLLMIAVGIVLATANAPITVAQEVAGVEISPTTTLPITGDSEATDGSYNFKSFADEPQPSASSEPDRVIGGHEYVGLGFPSGTLWATYYA